MQCNEGHWRCCPTWQTKIIRRASPFHSIEKSRETVEADHGPYHKRSCGPMDKASAHGAGDCRLESYQDYMRPPTLPALIPPALQKTLLMGDGGFAAVAALQPTLPFGQWALERGPTLPHYVAAEPGPTYAGVAKHRAAWLGGLAEKIVASGLKLASTQCPLASPL